MKIATLAQIKDVLPSLDLIPAIEEGFVAYSSGRAIVPPVGELILEKGEVHIKSGYIQGEDFYVIKIASGFYGNPALGLPSGNGCMLLFKQSTGESAAILLDEGHLTDVRTAVAGAVAAKYLRAPKGRAHRHRRRRRPGPAPARMADARHGLPGRPGLGAPGRTSSRVTSGRWNPAAFRWKPRWTRPRS